MTLQRSVLRRASENGSRRGTTTEQSPREGSELAGGRITADTAKKYTEGTSTMIANETAAQTRADNEQCDRSARISHKRAQSQLL